VARPDLYFSVDIEADGPIPGPYSMVALGACVAGTYDGSAFTRIDPEAHTFYAELKPISDRYEREALAVSGLSRDALLADGQDPKAAMTDFVAWVERMCAEHDRGHAVFAAYPLGFDWLFTYWYLLAYAGRSPFSHGRHIDIKTLFSARSGTPIHASTKRTMPAALLGTRAHTHNALDDAQGQADLLANLMLWKDPM
jgi:3' exoribonuclease, RNase T-like